MAIRTRKAVGAMEPEQFSGHAAISPETVCHRVYANKRAGGLLWKNLRFQKQRRKRYGKAERRGTIPNRYSIEDRPAIVETRSRIGDWEADTVIGKNHRQAIVSLVERKADSGIYSIRRAQTSQEQTVEVSIPLDFNLPIRSITKIESSLLAVHAPKF
jgi:IS30 family transposase